VSFYAAKIASQSLAPGATTVVNFDNVRHNDGGAFSLATDTFTVPYVGVYQCSIGLRVTSIEAGRSAVMSMYVNASLHVWLDSVNSNTAAEYWGMTASTILSLSAGDALDVRVSNSNVSTNASIYGFGLQYSYFSCARLY
jgi:hypothetical protein